MLEDCFNKGNARFTKSGNFHTKTNSNGQKFDNNENAKVFLTKGATAFAQFLHTFSSQMIFYIFLWLVSAFLPSNVLD